MINIFKHTLNLKTNEEDKLTKKVINNIIISFGVKGSSLILSFIIIPLTIEYINKVQYGIWITISSIVTWLSFFDFGFGNGLRNKLTKSKTLKENENSRKYVSTTYATLTVISILFLIISILIVPIIDWRALLNIPSQIKDNITVIILITIFSFSIQFVAQLINTVLTALHESAKVSIINLIGQLLVIIIIIYLIKNVKSNLTILIGVLTITPIIVLLMANIFLFKRKFKHISPSFKYIDIRYIKDIFSQGSSFFLIQIGVIILFQTDNFIINKILGPNYVTEFNITYKLFSLVTFIFIILVTPYWSAITESYTKNDFNWIRKSIKRMRYIWLMLSTLVIILIFSHKYIFKIWLGDTIRFKGH